jgi:hypothetical protein
MKAFCLLIVLLSLTYVSLAQAGSATITIAKTNTATVPATGYRVEERINGTWGFLQGKSTATTIPATQLTYAITNLSGTHEYSVVPFNDFGDGPRSNSALAAFLATDQTISISIGTSPTN